MLMDILELLAIAGFCIAILAIAGVVGGVI